MTRIRQNAIYICFALGALFGVLFLRSNGSSQARIMVGDVTIPVSVADTEAVREQGLSDTLHLKSGTGKLFIFDQSGRYGFWMKDMHYPLDIVWIDEHFTVISITTAYPESYPEVFYPPQDATYVLEVNADEAVRDGLVAGAKLQFAR